MEENQTIPGKEQNLQFTIGKSYGLSNKERKINDYQKKLESLRIEFENTTNLEMEEIKKSTDALLVEFGKVHEKILSSQMEIVEKLEKIMEKIIKHDTADLTKNSRLKEMADEVVKLSIETFKQNMKVLILGDQALSTKADEFARKFNSSSEAVEKKRLEFLERLKKDLVDYTEFEKGYLYGDALRIALEENPPKNND